MNNIDYIIKDNYTQRVFLSEDTLDVCEILQGNYAYLADAMRQEGLILKYGECNLFKELLYDNKVVGFCSYDFSREFITAALNNIYVLRNLEATTYSGRNLKRQWWIIINPVLWNRHDWLSNY